MVKTEVVATSPSGKLVIYTGRDEEMVQNVIDQFNEKYPDIEVEFLTMGAQQILERLRGESQSASRFLVGRNAISSHCWCK